MTDVLISIWFPPLPENPIMAFATPHTCLDTALRSVKCGAIKVQLAVQLVDGDPSNMVVWTGSYGSKGPGKENER